MWRPTEIRNIFIPKDYENIAEGPKLQVVPNLAWSNFQFDKLNWNNLQLRAFNSSFSNAFFTKIFLISCRDTTLKPSKCTFIPQINQYYKLDIYINVKSVYYALIVPNYTLYILVSHKIF
jgi:hypothetical protein